MKFIKGLKAIFKEKVYLFAILSFILIWILILVNLYLHNSILKLTIIIFGGGLLFFSITLFFISFFTSITTLKFYVVLIILVISLILAALLNESIYFPTSEYFFIIPLFANQIFTAFFAFKLCMDSSTNIDDFFYRRKKSRIVLRILEFIIFGILIWWIMRVTTIFFFFTPSALFQIVNRIIFIIFMTYLVLMGVVLLKLFIKKTFSAYITLFFFLTFCYILYILLDSIFGVFYSTELGDPLYMFISFIIDVVLFLYMLGTASSRAEFIKDKIKFLKIDTIILFLIIMKIYVQISKLVPRVILPDLQILQAGGLFIIFIICTLVFGIHSIIVHKPKEKKE